MFPRHGNKHPHPFRPPMPFGPRMVREMSQLVFLWNIKEEKEGITGYDLQKHYKAKQTSVYRTLKDMETKGYLVSEETIINGRAQKLYHITEKGDERLKELRDKWTTRIAFLSDVVPPERYPLHFIRRRYQTDFREFLEEVKTKEEFADYLSNIQTHLKHRKKRLEHQLQSINNNMELLEELEVKVNDLEEYNTETVKELIEEFLKKRKERT